VELRPLAVGSASQLDEVTALLSAALPHDHVAVVAAEKLFGGNGRRFGQTLGAFTLGSGELLGVVAQAGRWVKLLAVQPAARRRGIGRMLLAAARRFLDQSGSANAPPAKLRIADHPGNYLSPGIDERYREGQAFLAASGFVAVGSVLNLRAPLHGNPLLAAERIASCQQAVAAHGYTVRRVIAADVAPLLAMVAQQFSPVWADELGRALGPALGGEAAAQTPGLAEGAAVHVALDRQLVPVAFACHDGNNRGLGWFGPMGTVSSHRGRRLGELLLLHCLADVATFSRPEGGVIAWVGPVDFYARSCGARPDRRFIAYEES
jgi:GNAT superfamily N-acetyltransferase